MEMVKSSTLVKKYAIAFPIALVFYEIATYLSMDMYLPCLPSIEKDFQLSRSLAQYTLLSWFLGSASMQLFMGPLSDRFGRRVVLFGGGISFIVASFVCAITDNVTLFLIARFIQGSAVCSVMVAGYAAVHEYFDTQTAIKTLAMMGAVTILAPALGPLVGAFIVQYGVWQDVFWILTLWSLIAIGALYKIMPHTNKGRVELDFKKIMTDYFSIMLRGAFLKFTLPYCFMFMSIIVWIVQSPFLIIENYHYTPVVYGWVQFFTFGSFIMGTQMTRLLIAGSWVPLTIATTGIIGTLLGAGLLSATGFFVPHSLWWLVLGVMLMMFGSGIAFGPLNRLAVESCQEPMGRRIAVFSSYMSLFGVLGTFLVTRFHVSTNSQLSFLMVSGLALAGISFFVCK